MRFSGRNYAKKRLTYFNPNGSREYQHLASFTIQGPSNVRLIRYARRAIRRTLSLGEQPEEAALKDNANFQPESRQEIVPAWSVSYPHLP
jgi:hypothetical protein